MFSAFITHKLLQLSNNNKERARASQGSWPAPVGSLKFFFEIREREPAPANSHVSLTQIRNR